MSSAGSLNRQKLLTQRSEKGKGAEIMGLCINHPDKATRYLCMKHQAYMCEGCLRCRDNQSYCKFRPSCPIHFLHKEGNAEMIEGATEIAKNEIREKAA